jgi:exonuclease SbcD
MKILHTSDWHLGQKFLNHNRHQESEIVLDFLLKTIKKEAVKALIIAGDVFDTMNPPNEARTLYYNFLTKLIPTSCRHIIVIGGNHDSPTMLNAPKELLKTMNVHVIGSATENIEKEIIELYDENGNLEAVIAAVPFLRDSDIRKSIAGELFDDREKRTRSGIKKHYHHLAAAMEHYESFGVPIIATGHLFASKAKDNKESKIYVGSLDNIGIEDFPKLFDYVALGHIHKAQRVYYENKIRYSGSIIPLGFKEIEDVKSVYILDFNGRIFEKTTVELPITRRLISIRGIHEAVILELQALENATEDLTTWVEIVIRTDKMIPNLMDDLKDIIKNKNIEILNYRLENLTKRTEKSIEIEDLKTMSELEVFEKKCESLNIEMDNRTALIDTFKELINIMEE